ncbi:hypothetical protein L7F22_040041 [Adiantum nelumboides]|nr:hypothetical protein [Adiantum nelumboides]
MRTLEAQAHFMARTALVGSSSFKGCLQRSEARSNKSDLRASESLAQLKLTAEKMIQEQASVKTDLQVTYSKLEKSEQDVLSLETRLQDTKNENFVLILKQQEALKLWESLESKFSSTKTFCNQLMETLQQLAQQVHEGEQGKQILEEKLAERSRFHQEFKLQVDDLLLKKQNSERIAANWETEYGELEKLQKQYENTLAEETAKSRELQAEKAEVETHLRTSTEVLREEKKRLESAEMQLEQLRNEVDTKSNELEKMHAELASTKKAKDLQYEALEARFTSVWNRNNELQHELEKMASKSLNLEVANSVAKDNFNELLATMKNCKDMAEQERRAKEDTSAKLKNLELEYGELVSFKSALEKHVDDLKEELQVLKGEDETSRKRSAAMMQELKEELDLTRQKVDDLAEEKVKLARLSQDLELKVAELSATAKDLTNRRDQLVAENSSLLLEVKVANEIMKHSMEEKTLEIEKLERDNLKDIEALGAQEAEISVLRQSLSEKEKVIGDLIDEQKRLQGQYLKAIDQKVSAERLSHEIRRQAETQLETKLMELNKHIKEISERNDEEMKEITRKCESETKEAIKSEEQKASNLLVTMREEYELRLSKAQELSLLNHKSLEMEHQAQVREMMQNHEVEKRLQVSQHQAELNRMLEEKNNWVAEFGTRTDELEKKHADEIKKLCIDSCSKADDRALRLEQQLNVLQGQLKEEKSKRQEDLKAATRKYEEAVRTFEVDRKVYEESCKQSMLSIEALKTELKETKQKLAVCEGKCKSLERDDSIMRHVKNQSTQQKPNLLADQTYSSAVKGGHAVSCLNEGKKVESPAEKGKCESHTLPTHSKTVTHHEYEVATSDGRKTITRKRTKSTVMFESPLDVKRTVGKRKSTRISSQHRKIFRLHGMPETIVSDRDPKFTSLFWKAIWENIGTGLQFSSLFHLQIDGQSKIANSMVLDLLKSYISDQKTQWERYLPLVEFTYNNTIHSSTGKAPFEIVEGAMKVPPFLSTKDKIFEADEYTRDLDMAFAKVRETLQKSQERQKMAADRHRRDLK